MKARDLLDVVLFDLDGTVADTHGLILQCFDYAMKQHTGLAGKREIWKARIGLPLDDILCATYAHYGLASPTEAQLDAVKQTYRAHMRENDESIRAFDGVPEILATLKAGGSRLGIVTTKHRAMAVRHLERIGLLNLFESEAVICGDMCAAYKPSPEPFRAALRALGAGPESAAMVGDSEHDILGAKAAGLLAVAACWGTDNRGTLLAAGPDFIAEEPNELPGIFASAPGRRTITR